MRLNHRTWRRRIHYIDPHPRKAGTISRFKSTPIPRSIGLMQVNCGAKFAQSETHWSRAIVAGSTLSVIFRRSVAGQLRSVRNFPARRAIFGSCQILQPTIPESPPILAVTMAGGDENHSWYIVTTHMKAKHAPIRPPANNTTQAKG
jgi:hypothetical protein